MSNTALLNLRWARTLIDALVGSGVTRAVISPGSRSTPLALACERHPAIRTWIHIDERCAGFFALGLARADQRPVALIATSGSAPTHWYPAVIEACYSAVPLLLLSADRPPELHDCGANQTIDQTRLFGRQVRAFHPLPPPAEGLEQLRRVHQVAIRAARDSVASPPGPVHVNVPFREPLVPDITGLPEPAFGTSPAPPAHARPPPQTARLEGLAASLQGKPGIIVCGADPHEPDFATAVTALAERLGAPILADPLSGLRFGAHPRDQVIARYDAFLRRERFVRGHRPAWVLRFGAFPVSKALSIYLESCKTTEHYLVDAHGRNRDPLHRVAAPIRADPGSLCARLRERLAACDNRAWLEAFRCQEQRAAALAVESGPLEAAVIAQCIARLPEGSTLFASNSMAIRDIDGFSGSGAKPLRIVANRGASGIDGNLSTLLGLAAARHASNGSGRVLGIIGDLAFFHDMNALLTAREQNALIILINNGGGAIFGHLPQARLPEFERTWLTPSRLDFAKAAELYGLLFQRTRTAEDFAAVLHTMLQRSDSGIIEVAIDTRTHWTAHRRYWDAVAAA